jgi:predicted AAA+ superfamily ATPase
VIMGGSLTANLVALPRGVRARIERALLDTPAVFVAGPRQAGKSSLAHFIR